MAKLTGFAEMLEGPEAKSRRFAEPYTRVAQQRGCAFQDTGQVIVASDPDGIHLEASELQSCVWPWSFGRELFA